MGQKIIILESQYNRIFKKEVDEIATTEKMAVGQGSFHKVYPSLKNPNIVYKVGFEAEVDDWLNLFKAHPNIFPKVYNVGYINVKLKEVVTQLNWRRKGKGIAHKPGDNVVLKYVALERLDTDKAKENWRVLSINTEHLRNKSIQEYFSSIGLNDENEKEFLNIGLELKKERYPHFYRIFLDYYNLIREIYELRPNADVHTGNFGYDKQGNLKCLDI